MAADGGRLRHGSPAFQAVCPAVSSATAIWDVSAAGFSFALALPHPDRQVVCVIGDGSVGLNFAEFDTA